MANDLTSKFLISLATVLALLAVTWPYIEKSLSSSDKPCPLGYKSGDLAKGMHLPDGHPPVFPTSESSTPEKTGSGPCDKSQGMRLFHNASFWTAAQPGTTESKAMLVDVDGVILMLGSVKEARAAAADAIASSWRVSRIINEIDLQGAYVIPGLIDSHLHLLPGGLALTQARLSGVGSREEFQRVVAESADRVQPAAWVLGGGWVESDWGGALPDLAWADEVSGKHPVFLMRADGHSALANTAALSAAGISSTTPDPEHGHIDKDEHGHPTGILRESAIQLVTKHIPEPSLDALKAALQLAIHHALSRGVTTMVDMGRFPFSSSDPQSAWRDLELLMQPAADAGLLKARIVTFMPLSSWPRLAAKITVEGRGHPGGHLFWGGVKEFADGSLGSQTALMWEPYLQESTLGSANTTSATASVNLQAGTRSIPMDQLVVKIRAADRAGLQVAVHAIGDRAVDEVIAAYESAMEKHTNPVATNSGLNPNRHRIEHVQHIVGPATLARMAALGLLAVPNPLHMPGDVSNIQKLLGKERASGGRAYALRSMTDTLQTSFASDFPVVDLDLLESIFVAVHRRHSQTKTAAQKLNHVSDEGWTMQESVSMDVALRAHTQHAAFSCNLDGYVGQLLPGLQADMAVLANSPFLTGVAEMGMPELLSTWVAGECMFGKCS